MGIRGGSISRAQPAPPAQLPATSLTEACNERASRWAGLGGPPRGHGGLSRQTRCNWLCIWSVRGESTSPPPHSMASLSWEKRLAGPVAAQRTHSR
jgi:hypothetical protein